MVLREVSSKGPFKFRYFDFEGAGEKVRLAFVLAGIPFEDVRLKMSEWPAMKKTMKYGQVPKLEIGEDEDLYQSMAMMKYVALASDSKSLYPIAEPLKCVFIDEMLELCLDFDRAGDPCYFASVKPQIYGYPEDMDKEAKEALAKRLHDKFLRNDFPRFMAYFTTALETNDFLCGSEPTLADCYALPMLRYFTEAVQTNLLPEDCLDAYPAITAYVANMMALPPIAKWYELNNKRGSS